MQKEKKKKNKTLFFKKNIGNILLFLFVFLLPTQFGKHFFLNFSYVNGVKIDYLSLVFYLTDVLFLLIFFKNINFFKKYLLDFAKKKYWVLWFLFLLNIAFSKYYILSFYYLVKIVEIILIYILFKKENELNLINKAFFFGGLFQFFLAILQFINKASINGFFYFFGERHIVLSQANIAKASINGVEMLRPYGTFSHPNSMAGFYLILYFYFLSSKNLEKFPIRYKQLALIMFTILIFISFSKTAIISYFIFNILYVAFYKKNIFKNYQKILIILIISLSFLVFSAKTDPLSLEKRMLVLQNSLSIITNNFIFGVGLGHYLIYQANFPIKYSFFFLQPVHNIFLLFFSQLGILLSFFIIGFLIRILKNEYKKISFVLIFGAIIFTGTFDHYWITLQQNWLLIGIIFGLIKREEIIDIY